MKIAVINYSSKQGVTFQLTKNFLNNFKDVEIKQFYLCDELDCFCVGCLTCFTKGEQGCNDFENVNKIKEGLMWADLLVFAYPTYVFHAPAVVKSLLDHLGYMWMVHRPEREMFKKRAVIITQCLGAGAKSATKDVKDSLSWWEISKIYTFKIGIRDKDVVWNNIGKRRKTAIMEGIQKFGKKVSKTDFSKSPKVKLIIKLKFNIVRMMQKSIISQGINSIDANHWESNGWLNNNSPWKN